MPKPSRLGYIQSYPHLLVDFGDGDFNSCLRATKTFKAGDYVAPLELGKLTKGPKTYTSVQYGPGSNDHIELNSDLVYSAALISDVVTINE
ncbi:hypothetical protein Agabi119p4_6561 [Agaricus bisporus var. burnettii]|uniref:Uncharacterized protein n=1 Tax=Agaricus bisporus var. burnettii TaxID=192524 RepID=A0A8H7EZS8_AGABI|nr:hypothetical protein Agabi119p4_6561 [Agaricus bisporus var. burnettii]